MSKLGPKCQVLCDHHYFPALSLKTALLLALASVKRVGDTALTLLAMEFTRASQVATGVLFHSSMMTSQNWWMLETLRSSTFHLKIPHRLPLPSASLARQWSSWRCIWGRYHVGILPRSPVSEGRGSCSASVCHSTCWHSWFPQWTVAPQSWLHPCSPRPWHSHHHVLL